MKKVSNKKLKTNLNDLPERDHTDDKPYFDDGEMEHTTIPNERPAIVPQRYYVMHDKPPRSMNHTVSCRIIH